MSIPALTCPLKGHYLIEASAGTGKTWTLSALLMRLLIEERVPPESILATTFTNKAADEMRERIASRLNSFATLLDYAITHPIIEIEDWLNVHIDQKSLQDPLNTYLLRHIWHEDGNLEALYKMRHIVRGLYLSLGRLFVGTLDSLTAHLIQNFGAPFGLFGLEICDSHDQKAYLDGIFHTHLRSFMAHLQTHHPRWFEYLQATGGFLQIQEAKLDLLSVLDFYKAPIDTLEFESDTFERLEAVLLTAQFGSEWDILCNIDNAGPLGLHTPKQKALIKWRTILKDAKDAFATQEYGKLGGALDVFKKQTDKTNFDTFLDANVSLTKKTADPCAKAKVDALMAGGAVREVIGAFAKAAHAFNAQREALLSDAFSRFIKSARELMFEHFEHKGQTTFAQNLERLNEALHGSKGRGLRGVISFAHPYILIDEAQDLNDAQRRLIEHLAFSRRGKFLLLVGDPKQAIYGFRGGDVANYLALKTRVLKGNADALYTLDVNRRTNASLIRAISAMYGMHNPSDEASPKRMLGQGIFYPWVHALDDAKTSIELDNADAAQSASLQCSEQTPFGVLMLQTDAHYDDLARFIGNQPLDGACVLAPDNRHLDALSQALTKYKIPHTRHKDTPLFASLAAMDVWVLLDAMSKSKPDLLALLTTHLFNFGIQEAQSLIQDASFVHALTASLTHAYALWQDRGAGAALVWFLGQPLPAPLDGVLWVHTSTYLRLGQTKAHGEALDIATYLGDLHALIDRISRVNLSIYALKNWYKDAMKSDQTPSLSHKSGLILMTAHASKGLEFERVYVLGFDTARRVRAPWVYTYHIGHTLHVATTPDHLEAHKEDAYFERARLLYVALTRASGSLYLALDVKKLKQDSLLSRYFTTCGEKDIKTLVAEDFFLPIPLEDVPKPKMNQNTPKDNSPLPDWDACIQKQHFYGARKTSFSALIHALDAPYMDADALEAGGDLDQIDAALSTCYNRIRFEFVRGASAGNFLHEAFETYIKTGTFGALVYLARSYQIPLDAQDEAHLAAWFADIIAQPLSSGASLMHLTGRSGVYAELDFSMHVAQKPVREVIRGINAAFAAHSDRPLHLSGFDAGMYEMVRGEIDLVYTHEGRYYILDYKSNHLGNADANYKEASLAQAMDKAGYWLQAALYQLALHRLLKSRLAGYSGNEGAYLGAVEYLFLRGMTGQEGAGVISWQVPLGLIFALDEVLG